MHWLDSTPSREIDPVLDCLAFLARQADRPSSPVLLRAGLALSDDGTLPFHQIEPALDQVGMRGEPVVRRLKGCTGLKRALSRGLTRAAGVPTHTAHAWAMRDTFDGVADVITKKLGGRNGRNNAASSE